MNAGRGVPEPTAVSGSSPISTPLGGPSAGSVIWITESEGEPSGNLFTTKIRLVTGSYATPSGAPPATAVGMRSTSEAGQVRATPEMDGSMRWGTMRLTLTSPPLDV